MKRGHTQRESEVLCQQLRQVEMSDGDGGDGQQRGREVNWWSVCGKKKKRERKGELEGYKVKPIQL